MSNEKPVVLFGPGAQEALRWQMARQTYGGEAIDLLRELLNVELEVYGCTMYTHRSPSCDGLNLEDWVARARFLVGKAPV